MVSQLGVAVDVALIGNTQNVDSAYNKGPRSATNTWAAGFFLVVNLVFIIWGSVGIAGSDSAIFLTNYNANDWVVDSSSTCCNFQTDSGCKDNSIRFKLALSNGSAFFGVNEGTDNDSTSKCVSGLPDETIHRDIASPVVMGVFGSIALGCVILIGFRQIPYIMVYFVVCLKIVVPTIIGIIILNGTSVSVDTDPAPCVAIDSSRIADCEIIRDESSCDSQLECTWNAGYSGESPVPAYVCFAISAFMALVFWWYRKELDLCARLFKVSSRALQDSWQLLPVNAVFGGIVGLVKVGMLVMIVVSVLTTNVVPVVSYVSGEGSHECSPQIRDGWYQFVLYGLFTVAWFGFWALETRDYIVGDTIGAWYWHGKQGASTTRAVKHAFCSHFGTMAYAGLVMYFVEKLKKRAKYRGMNVFACLLACIAQCILGYIEYLCKMSVLMTSITGNHFIGSGKEVVKLFTSSFGNMKASTGVWWIPRMIIGVFVKLSAFTCAFLAGWTMYKIIGRQGDETTQAACDAAQIPLRLGILIGIFVLVLMLFLLSFFGQILLTTVDTIYLCFIIDRSKGVITHQDLHDILSEVIGKRKDVQLLAVPTAVAQQYTPPQQQYILTETPASPKS